MLYFVRQVMRKWLQITRHIKCFGDIAAAGTIAAWNISNFVMDICKLPHAGANR